MLHNAQVADGVTFQASGWDWRIELAIEEPKLAASPAVCIIIEDYSTRTLSPVGLLRRSPGLGAWLVVT